MSILLIEPILDRYVAQAERQERDWNPKEVEALLLKLRKEIWTASSDGRLADEIDR